MRLPDLAPLKRQTAGGCRVGTQRGMALRLAPERPSMRTEWKALASQVRRRIGAGLTGCAAPSPHRPGVREEGLIQPSGDRSQP